jgi:hypothetical protein
MPLAGTTGYPASIVCVLRVREARQMLRAPYAPLVHELLEKSP